MDLSRKLSNGQSLLEFIHAKRNYHDQSAVTYSVENHRQWLDIAYGHESERQRLDIHSPRGEGPFPVIVWVHGGGWYTGDRSDRWLEGAFPFVDRGYAIVSIGYRLADEAVFPQPVEDVISGIEHIELNGAQFGLDTTRIGVMGGSAGGNIAAHVGLLHKKIRAAQLSCAPLDFSTETSQFEQLGMEREGSTLPEADTSYEALYLGGGILERPESCENANPARHIGKDAPRFLLVHGTGDHVVPYQQSVDFAHALKRATGDASRAQVILIPDGDHDSPMDAFHAKLEFFDKYLKTIH